MNNEEENFNVLKEIIKEIGNKITNDKTPVTATWLYENVIKITYRGEDHEIKKTFKLCVFRLDGYWKIYLSNDDQSRVQIDISNPNIIDNTIDTIYNECYEYAISKVNRWIENSKLLQTGITG